MLKLTNTAKFGVFRPQVLHNTPIQMKFAVYAWTTVHTRVPNVAQIDESGLVHA